MANSVEIPQDIIDNVIAALGNDKHWHALKQCALVSSSFLLPSRKQLFYSISFGSSNEGCQRLHQVLVQNPVIRSFVRRINVDVHRQWRWGGSGRTEPASEKVLLAILQLPFCHLEGFFLSYFDAAKSWSGELKDALSTLIHSPTLRFLSLFEIDNVPITLFFDIAHFTELRLSNVSLNYSDGEQSSSLTPKGVATTTSWHNVNNPPITLFHSMVHLTKLHLMSVSLKDTLSILKHSPTLKILYLFDIDNVPITIFLGIVHLTELHLSYVSLNYSDGEQSSSLTSKGMATTVSHPVIDRCVWSFGKPKRDYPTEARFLPFMSHLRVLAININPSSAKMSDFAILSFLMGCLCASLSSPATLKHLELNITFKGNNNRFNHDAFYRDLGRDAVWRHLDSLVTHPAGSQLQRVDIDIRYSFRYDDYVVEPKNDEILAAVLGGLPLLRDKGILFVEAKVGS